MKPWELGRPEAVDILMRARAQMRAILEEIMEFLQDYPGIAHRAYETWVARIETALGDENEFCDFCEYNMLDTINDLEEML